MIERVRVLADASIYICEIQDQIKIDKVKSVCVCVLDLFHLSI